LNKSQIGGGNFLIHPKLPPWGHRAFEHQQPLKRFRRIARTAIPKLKLGANEKLSF
jgi:hypothetical protein